MEDPRDTAMLDRLESFFVQTGVSRVTVGTLAKEMRCSRRRLYQLADSKEALIERVLKRLYARVQREGHEAAAKQDGIDQKVRAYFEPGLQAALTLSDQIQRDFEEISSVKALYDEHQRRRTEGLSDIIRGGIESGEVVGVDPRIAAEMMFLIVQRVRQPAFQELTGIPYPDGLAAAYEILRRGLLTSKATQG